MKKGNNYERRFDQRVKGKSNIKYYEDDSPPHIPNDDPELTTPRHRLHHSYALLSWLHFYDYYYLLQLQMIGGAPLTSP
jgi:hypothetical protein